MFRKQILPCLALCQVLGLGAASYLGAQDAPQAVVPVADHAELPAAQGGDASRTGDSGGTSLGSDSGGTSRGTSLGGGDGSHTGDSGGTSFGSSDSGGTSLGAASSLLKSIKSRGLREVALEVLERNPEIARAERLAVVAELQAPQLRALPDPVAALSLFVLPPETRAGPQRLSLSLQQKLPWFGKLALREQTALYAAAAARAEVETVRLDLLTKARRLAHELTFLDAYEAVVSTERGTLVRYEGASQARYASGTGLQQEIVRIQAQITRADTRLLEIAERRSKLTANLNRLRDRPMNTPFGELEAYEPPEPIFDPAHLLDLARSRRPELVAAEARIAAGSTLVSLAEKGYRPDVTLGLSYTAVEPRQDRAGRLSPPEDNGDDILALSGSLNLPIRRQKLAAGLEGAQASKWAAEEAKRAVLADIESAIGDLTTRMPLLFEHLSLLEKVLEKQARESLRSAETAYSTGKLNAVDLLDAEVVLLEVQIAAARTRADLAIARVELERAVGQSIEHPSRELQP